MRALVERARARLARLLAEPSPAEVFLRSMPPSLAVQRELVERHRLDQLLPWESYDPATGLFYNDDSLGFVLRCVPSTGLREEQLSVLAGLYKQRLKPGTTVQTVLWASPDVWRQLDAWRAARRGTRFAELADRRVRHLGAMVWRSAFGQPWVLRDFELVISVQRPLPPDGGAERAEAEHLVRLREAFAEILESAGIPARPCDADAFLDLADGMIAPAPGPRSRLRWVPDDGRLLREQALPGEVSVSVGRDGLAVARGEWVLEVRPLSVRQYPRQWSGTAMAQLIGDLFSDSLRVPAPFLLSQTVVVPDHTAALARSRLKSARATQMADSPIGRYLPQWAERKREWDWVTRMQEDGHQIVQQHFQIVLYAPPEHAEYAEQRLRAVFEALGWSLVRDRFIALPAWLSALPLTAGPERVRELKALRRLRTVMSWNAVSTAPVVGEWKGLGAPLLLLAGRRGQLMSWDPFANEQGNFNIACAAASGSGKSVMTQELLVSLLATGGRCWVIDSGRSYEHTCRLLGGTFIEFARERAISLNPFSRIGSLEDLAEQMEVLKGLVAQMAQGAGRPLDSVQLAALEEAIRRVFTEEGPEMTVTSIARWLERRGAADGARFVARMLYPYTAEGTYGRFFEGRSSVDLDAPFVVLELGELDRKPELRAVVLQLLIADISQAMYLGDLEQRRQRKLCIIDEAWKLMEGVGGQFLEAGYRTARRHGGSFMTITQSVHDYYRTEAARAAWANSDWRLLLRHNPEDLEAARKEDRLAGNDGFFEVVRSLKTLGGRYSEMAIYGPGGLAVGRLVLDPYARTLYSSKAEDWTAVEALVREGASVEEAVERLAAEG
ncbi:MAG TPA: type IV secretion system protein TraC [Chromatiales bacterium]|nr:type IV secretion system protein TraC [Chromatiales bacterium]